MKKCIVTVLGEDTVGIIAKVCTYLAENEINILDISQTIVQHDDDCRCCESEERFQRSL